MYMYEYIYIYIYIYISISGLTRTRPRTQPAPSHVYIYPHVLLAGGGGGVDVGGVGRHATRAERYSEANALGPEAATRRYRGTATQPVIRLCAGNSCARLEQSRNKNAL